MKKVIFKGIATAMVTPMKADGSVDYDAFARHIEFQIGAGINGLVICATTGEAPTLSDKEHIECLNFAGEKIAGRVPFIAGTGSNDTAHAVMMTKEAKAAGADAVLCVTPYYNKTTQRGLVASFSAIADAADVPVIVYNVPSRTGLNIVPETYKELSKHPNIVATKEAGGSISAVIKTRELCGDDLWIYSGEDDQTIPIMAMGGLGCISTISNILPAEITAMAKLMLEGKLAEAAERQIHYKSLIDALFCETNPIPVKTALAAMGRIDGTLRLPLVPMEEKNRKMLLDLMRAEGLGV